jgi:hypothetical protein
MAFRALFGLGMCVLVTGAHSLLPAVFVHFVVPVEDAALG